MVWYISIFISYIISLLVYSVIRKKTTSNSTDHAVLYKYNLLHISNYQFWIGPLQTIWQYMYLQIIRNAITILHYNISRQLTKSNDLIKSDLNYKSDGLSVLS